MAKLPENRVSLDTSTIEPNSVVHVNRWWIEDELSNRRGIGYRKNSTSKTDGIESPVPNVDMVENQGMSRFNNFISTLNFESKTSDLVDNGDCYYVVTKTNKYTFHFSLFKEDWNECDPEIIVNIYGQDVKYKSIADSLSEIQYRLENEIFDLD